MSTTMRAIETVYRGFRFRSRLESRWAVFFDAVNVAWEYETEGYELGSVRYLPDFYLPQSRTFVEVKPRRGETIDRKPLAAVESAPGLFHGDGPERCHMVVVYGDPAEADADTIDWSSWQKRADVSAGGLPHICPTCHVVRFDRYHSSIGVSRPHTCGGVRVWLPTWQAFVSDAALAARQARFEHGEQPSLVAKVEHRFHDKRPPIYLAGKIGRSGNDWRERIGAPAGNRDHKGDQYAMGAEIPTRYGGWKYNGPDLSIDHGELRHDVAYHCLNLLRHCNTMFAWIDRTDVHGTMAEIGAWQGVGLPRFSSPLFVGFSSIEIQREVWFAENLATCSAVVPDVRQAWTAFVEWYEYDRCYQGAES